MWNYCLFHLCNFCTIRQKHIVLFLLTVNISCVLRTQNSIYRLHPLSFPGAWHLEKKRKKKEWKVVSQHPFSSHTNTAASSIPGGQTLHGWPCWFHLLRRGGRWGQYAACSFSVLFCMCGRGSRVSSASPGRKMLASRAGRSPPLPVFGDRKKLLWPFSVLPSKSGNLQICRVLDAVLTRICIL